MKKLVLFVAMSCLLSGSVLAENQHVSEKVSHDEDRTMAITWNPLALLTLSFGGSYGVKITDKMALIVPFSVMYLSSNITSGGSNAGSYLFGLSSGLGARFYFSGGPFKDGFFIQPTAEIGWMSFGGNASSLMIGGYATLGYSWVWQSGFMLNLAAGPRYTYMSTKADAKNDVFALHGFLPTLEFSIGYAW